MDHIGIDIGSTCAKTIVLDDNKDIIMRFVLPTGWSSVDTAEKIRQELQIRGADPGQAYCVATGYGRAVVPYADRQVTEITCHGKGACLLHRQTDLTVIDIGGQDTKIIRVDNGMVSDFSMNDKCSAGTGRFLEVMANTLALTVEQLCELAGSGGGASISSMCTVFAESEVISLIGRGEEKQNIAFAVVDSIIRKVSSQAGRFVKGSGAVCLTGGLSGTSYIQSALSDALKVPVLCRADGRYAGALGAALCAWQDQRKEARHDLS